LLAPSLPVLSNRRLPAKRWRTALYEPFDYHAEPGANIATLGEEAPTANYSRILEGRSAHIEKV
jgi:hypothetical protein